MLRGAWPADSAQRPHPAPSDEDDLIGDDPSPVYVDDCYPGDREIAVATGWSALGGRRTREQREQQSGKAQRVVHGVASADRRA